MGDVRNSMNYQQATNYLADRVSRVWQAGGNLNNVYKQVLGGDRHLSDQYDRGFVKLADKSAESIQRYTETFLTKNNLKYNERNRKFIR